MRICFLAAAHTPHSYRWIQFFCDRGHEVHWITLDPPNAPVDERIHLHDLSKIVNRTLRVLTAVPRVKKIFKRIQPDLVHAHYAGTYGLVAALTRFRPAILTAWGSDVLFAGQNPLTRPLVRMALRHPNLLTCDAEHMKQAMINLGADRSIIELVRFGVTLKPIPSATAKREARDSLGIGDESVVISARNLDSVYDVATLIRSIPAVLSHLPNTRFLILGDGPQRPELEAAAEQLGVEGAIRFVGSVDYREIDRYFAASDVYVSTSLSDAGLSATTGEAMAGELPVVITDSEENRRWVTEGTQGSIFRPGDSDALASKIALLLTDSALRKQMGIAGRATIAARNNYEVEMEKMELLCFRTVGAR